MTIYSDIKSMRIRSANTIAIMGLKYLQAIAKKHGFEKRFYTEAQKLLRTRPTAVVMHNAIGHVHENPTLDEITKTIEFLESAKYDIAKAGRRLFVGGRIVLTHCESTETLELFRYNRKSIRNIYVTETRPFMQGIGTAKELAKSGIKTSLIIDSAIGYYIPECDIVVVGADSLREEGLINKIGTLPLAVLAKEYHKPFYVATNTYKIDRRKKFEIEKRNPVEVHRPMKGVKILDPVFDVTPWRCITGIITEKGILSPERIKAMI